MASNDEINDSSQKWALLLGLVVPMQTSLQTILMISNKSNTDIQLPLYGRLFVIFILVFFWPYLMIICFLTRILHKKKSISMQLLESPIPPLTAAALRMIICKRPVPPDDHLQEASPSVSSFARGRPLRMTIYKRPVSPDHHLQEAGPSF